ncbi:MAG TPA: hypothetical protein VE573_18165 [Nitrososphaeraceae archaeon]|nr:hypothetical protein [Nitrososphaeraceae archaeon]
MKKTAEKFMVATQEEYEKEYMRACKESPHTSYITPTMLYCNR